jgi:hypothetical protein
MTEDVARKPVSFAQFLIASLVSQVLWGIRLPLGFRYVLKLVTSTNLLVLKTILGSAAGIARRNGGHRLWARGFESQ